MIQISTFSKLANHQRTQIIAQYRSQLPKPTDVSHDRIQLDRKRFKELFQK